MRAATAAFTPYAPVPFSISDWSRAVEEAYRLQWCSVARHPDGGWDWPEIKRRFHAPSDQILAIRCGERLSALGLITASKTTVKLAFLEGDPRRECPLKGLRAMIALEVAAMFGQRMGRAEIRLDPVNPDLKELYCGPDYGFEEVSPRKGEPYLRKDLRA